MLLICIIYFASIFRVGTLSCALIPKETGCYCIRASDGDSVLVESSSMTTPRYTNRIYVRYVKLAELKSVVTPYFPL